MVALNKFLVEELEAFDVSVAVARVKLDAVNMAARDFITENELPEEADCLLNVMELLLRFLEC